MTDAERAEALLVTHAQARYCGAREGRIGFWRNVTCTECLRTRMRGLLKDFHDLHRTSGFWMRARQMGVGTAEIEDLLARI